MSTQTADWMTSKDRACLGQAALFQASILDYSPTSEEFADLTDAEHTALAAEKEIVEEKAVDTCYGCPFMMECEAWSIENRVSGVAGGRTETERDDMRTAAGLDKAEEQAVEPAVCAGDRGKRGKIDDATVDRLTASQWTSEEIARHMGCSVRSITRSRDRIAKAAAKAASADSAAQADERMAAMVTDDAKVAAARSAAAGAAFVAYTSGRPVTNIACPAPTATTPAARRLPSSGRVSAPMKAIYDTLADGGWHTREDLINTGALFVTDTEALAWWEKNIAAKSKSPAIHTTSPAKRIADGARDKVSNALSASSRNGKHTVRGGQDGTDASLFRLASHTPAELVTT